MAYADFSICERFRVTETGREPYELETNVQDTIWYEMRPKQKGREEDSTTVRMLHLVWHAARRLGYTEEPQVAGWMAKLDKFEIFAQDDEDAAEAEAEDEDASEDPLDEFEFLDGVDPTR